MTITNPKKPFWFMLSYDATKELYELKSGEKYDREDFRKHIIRTLRTKKVEEMYEYVETTIHFLDPDKLTDVTEKLRYWDQKFKEYGDDFNFVLLSIYYYSNEKPIMTDNRKITLNENFNKLFKQVKDNEKLKPRT